ncbi:26284_t:CDS:1, partial [Gigaspora margarita]
TFLAIDNSANDKLEVLGIEFLFLEHLIISSSELLSNSRS